MVDTPKQGDIVRLCLDPKRGHEQQGYRPYLCLSNIVISEISNIAVFAPISNTNRDYPFYYSLDGLEINTTGRVMLDQLVAVDYNARAYSMVESISKRDMRVILEITKLVFEEDGR